MRSYKPPSYGLLKGELARLVGLLDNQAGGSEKNKMEIYTSAVNVFRQEEATRSGENPLGGRKEEKKALGKEVLHVE